MLKVTLRNLLARRFRLFTTGLAIILGVAFMTGSLVLSDTVSTTFGKLFTDVFAGMDAVARGAQPFDDDFAVRPRLDAGLLATVAAVDGVAAAEGDIFGYAQILGSDGKELGTPGMGAPTFGANWKRVDELNQFKLFEGRAPAADDELVIDRKSAKDGDLRLGSQTRVLTRAGSVPVTVVGIVKFGSADSPGGASFALFTERAAQNLIAEPGKYDAIDAVAEKGVSQAELRRRIDAALPAPVEVVTGATITKENQDDIEQGVSFFRTFMLVFAFIALFVGSFIIFNTFSILVAQRTRELALFRTLGASRRQVLRAVVLEATIVGLLSAAAGLVLGIGLAALMKGALAAFGFDFPASGLTVTLGTAIAALVIGLVVTLVAALAPAWRASRVPPLAALRDVAVERVGSSRRRIIFGGAMVALGVLLLLSGGAGDGRVGSIALGAILTFVGQIALGPVLAPRASAAIGAPLVRWRGLPGALARGNAIRNPKRTAATASALVIGVAIISLVTVLAASAKASIQDSIDERFKGDLQVSAGPGGFGGGFFGVGMSPAVGDRIEQLPEIDRVARQRGAVAEIAGDRRFPIGADDDFVALLDFDVKTGRVTGLGPTDLVVSEQMAEDKHWRVGTKLPVKFVAATTEFTVVGIFDNPAFGSNFLTSLAAFEANLPDQYDTELYLTTADGVGVDQAKAAVARAVADFPNAEVRTKAEYEESSASQFNFLLAFIYVLLALAVLIALLGIANTLALSVVERTRELGLLRAVGMTRQQLRSSIRWEAMIIALFGAVGGLVLGVFFGWALLNALGTEGFDVLRIPVGQLLVIVVVASGAGIAAAWLPARRAARLDVLAAIATE